MTHRSIFDEIALHTYMQKLGLTVEEAQEDGRMKIAKYVKILKDTKLSNIYL